MSEYIINFPFSSSSISSVTGSTASTTLLATDYTRGKFSLMHSGSARAYVLLSNGTASSTNFTIFLDSGVYYEDKDYKGPVNIAFNGTSAGTYVFATSFYK